VANPQIADELAQAAADLFLAKGSKRAAAKAAGLSRSAFRNRLKRAAERGMLPTKPVMPGFEIKQTSAQLDAGGNVEREWVQQRPEAGPDFALPAGHILKGVSALTDAEGRTLYEWKKTRLDDATPHVVAALEAVFKSYRGKAAPIPPPRRSDADLLSVYPIADLHLGMLSWRPETGEDYDLRIASRRLRDTARRLIAQAPCSRKAIILNLGDWQHTDDQRNMTPRSGHILDADSRYVKILTAGVRLMIDCIDLALQKHELVIVRNIPGNHDPHASIALTVGLANFYARNKRVVVDDDPGEFFFHRFGATLIGAHHGHRARPDRLAMAMAVRRRADWGATRYHYFYFGHIHHESAREVGDVRVESFQTLAAKDAHSVGMAYVSGQSLSSITIHKRDGEIGRHRVNIPPPEAP